MQSNNGVNQHTQLCTHIYIQLDFDFDFLNQQMVDKFQYNVPVKALVQISQQTSPGECMYLKSF